MSKRMNRASRRIGFPADVVALIDRDASAVGMTRDEYMERLLANVVPDLMHVVASNRVAERLSPDYNPPSSNPM